MCSASRVPGVLVGELSPKEGTERRELAGLSGQAHCVFSLTLPLPATPAASRKYPRGLQPEGMIVPGESSHPPPNRFGQARELGLGCEGVLVPARTEAAAGRPGAGPGQGEAGQDPSARPSTRMSRWSLCARRLCPLVCVPLPAAEGSADSRFPRVFRGYAERKRRKRENESASVIQR